MCDGKLRITNRPKPTPANKAVLDNRLPVPALQMISLTTTLTRSRRCVAGSRRQTSDGEKAMALEV